MNKVLLALGVCLAGCGGAQPRQDRPAVAAQLDDATMKEALAAIKWVDDGHASDAIPVFKRLLQKYPSHPALVTELAHAYLDAGQPKQAIEVLDALRGSKDFEVKQYVVWGSALDAAGDPIKAQAAFDEGLAKFPGAGELYTNAGITALKRKQLDNAIRYFESGIAADPMHASNYFFAANMYSNSDEKMWALIYGEVFMNLERGTERTEKMSSIIDGAFRRAIQIDKASDGNVRIGVSLSKAANTITPGAGGLPFEAVYELKVTKSLAPALAASQFAISLELFAKVREGFVTSWFAEASGARQAYPLFLYQREVARAGHLDAYSHWLFGMGNEQEMSQWLAGNAAAFHSFVAWFKDHPMSVTAQIARTRQ